MNFVVAKKIILNLIFIPLFWVLSYIIPKDNKLVILGSYFGYRFIGNPKFFYLYLCKSVNVPFRFVWITRNRKIYKQLKKEKRPVLYLYSFAGIYAILRAKYFIIGEAAQDITGTAFLLGKYYIIECWHATPLKNISRKECKGDSLYKKLFWFFMKKEFQLYNIVLACSDEAAKHMKVALYNKNVLVFGYPRNDIFFDKDLYNNRYKSKFFLANYEKVILYAPTFRDAEEEIEPFSYSFLINFNNYLKASNYIFLIKNHPISLFGKRIKVLNLSNIVDVSDMVDDIQDILIDTDLLVTDYSGVMFEYCLMKKPIVFYAYDYEKYISTSRDMLYDYFKEIVGPFALTEEDLFMLIKEVNNWFYCEQYQRDYDAFIDRFNLFRDGDSSRRLYEFVSLKIKGES